MGVMLFGWINMWYARSFLCQYTRPSFLAYSIIYDEDNDQLVFHLADRHHLKPKSLFLTISNARNQKPLLAPDCQVLGILGQF